MNLENAVEATDSTDKHGLSRIINYSPFTLRVNCG